MRSRPHGQAWTRTGRHYDPSMRAERPGGARTYGGDLYVMSWAGLMQPAHRPYSAILRRWAFRPYPSAGLCPLPYRKLQVAKRRASAYEGQGDWIMRIKCISFAYYLRSGRMVS